MTAQALLTEVNVVRAFDVEASAARARGTRGDSDYGGGGNSHGVCRTVSNATNPQGQLFAGLVTG